MIFTVSSKSCRICLSSCEESDSKTIYNYCCDEMDYSFTYEFCTGYTTSNNSISILPTNICHNCEDDLLKLYMFKKKCETAENVLEFVKSLKENKIEDIDHLESIRIKIESTDGEVVLSIHSTQDSSTKVNSDETTEPLNYITDIEHFSETELVEDKYESIDYDDESQTQKRKTKLRPKKLCQQCGKIVSSAGMKNHLLTHTKMNEEDKKNSCDICGKRYKYSDTLIKHKRVHSDDKRYECQYCNKKFMIWATRRRHIDKEHTGVKRFDCHICDAQFFDGSARTKHVRQHLGERPYECNICHKKFIEAHKRNLHMMVHANEKQFICDICNASFNSITRLKLHKRTHLVNRCFTCPLCNKTFVQNYKLRTHINKFHTDYVLPAPGTVLTLDTLQKGKTTDSNSS